MEYLLKMSGGFGGIEISGRVSISELPPGLEAQCKECFQPQKLRKYKKRSFGMASKTVDGRIFQLSIKDDKNSGGDNSYDLYESELPEELAEVLDELMTCIVKNKSDQREAE